MTTPITGIDPVGVVVAIIIAVTSGCGAALILSAPWLFWTGVAVAASGVIVGRATYAFQDASV